MLLDVSTGQGYVLATALRGPDNGAGVHSTSGGMVMKQVTTAVIRHALDIDPRYAIVATPALARYLMATMPPARHAQAKLEWRQHVHFQSHIAEAVVMLEKYPDKTKHVKAVRDAVEWLGGWGPGLEDVHGRVDSLYS